MSLNINTKPRTYDDAMNAYHNYTHKWQDFIIQCPDLLNTYWFYEGKGISDNMAVEMRRLISVWTMLFGSDIVRILLSVTDFEVARTCRQELFQRNIDPSANYCVTAFVVLLQTLVMCHRGAEDQRLERLYEMMVPLKHDAFIKAWEVVRP